MLDDYFDVSKVENSGITKDDFQVFDSGWEAEIHKVLSDFIAIFNRHRGHEALALYSQVKVDLSQKAFCKLGYKIDFLIAINNDSKKVSRVGADWMQHYHYFEPDLSITAEQGLFPHFVEAKGVFTAESRFKHLLLEHVGMQHGRDIDIVQPYSNLVSRGKDSYRTLSVNSLKSKLSILYPQ